MLALALAGCGDSKTTTVTAPARTVTAPVATTTAPATSTTTTPASTTPPAGATATSADGKFEVVVPRGFHDRTTRARGATPIRFDLALVGPLADRFATNINVVHEPAPTDDIDAVTKAEQAGVNRLLKAHSMGSISSETVDGEPARAYDFLATPVGRTLLHEREVIVVHDSTVYVITLAALPRAYADGLPALAATLAGWHWR